MLNLVRFASNIGLKGLPRQNLLMGVGFQGFVIVGLFIKFGLRVGNDCTFSGNFSMRDGKNGNLELV